jgi:protein disulfide isomerase family A protein 3
MTSLRNLNFIFLLFLALSFVSAEIETDDGVYVLKESNFDSFVDNEAFTIVEFYAPWCGHCKKLAPEYAKAAKILAQEDPPIKLAKVDATEEKSLGDRFGVRGYPTIKIFRNGAASEYDGPRESSGIVRYVKQKSAPASRLLESVSAVEQFINHKDETSIVFFGPATSALFEAFKSLANELRDNFRFGYANDEDILKHFGITDEKIALHIPQKYSSKLEKSRREFSGSSKDELKSFLRDQALPLAGEISADNLQLYKDRGLPVVKLYTDVDWERNPKGTNYFLNRLRKVGEKFANLFSFAVASKKSYANELNDLGLTSTESPVVIHDLKKNQKFRREDAKFSLESLEALIQEFIGGKMEPHIKSEPIPESNDEDVKIVVAKNFHDIVLDPSKDVLLEAYAPWCGHCKSLEPKYKELAKKVKGTKSLVIAKVDATANDLPPEFPVHGFPTIYFVPANDKAHPIKYDGGREVDDFLAFLKKKVHFPLQDTKDEL